MYDALLLLHSWVRWAVVIVGTVAVARAAVALLSRTPWRAVDDRLGRWFVVLFDVQLLLGVALYALFSPTVKRAAADLGAAMADPVLRFWAVEHALMMLIALVAAHVGAVLVRRADTPAGRHRRALVWRALALAIVLAATPWPFAAAGRPWLRLGPG